MCLELRQSGFYSPLLALASKLQRAITLAIKWLLRHNWLDFSNILKELQSTFPISAAHIRAAEVRPKGKLCGPRV